MPSAMPVQFYANWSKKPASLEQVNLLGLCVPVKEMNAGNMYLWIADYERYAQVILALDK